MMHRPFYSWNAPLRKRTKKKSVKKFQDSNGLLLNNKKLFVNVFIGNCQKMYEM